MKAGISLLLAACVGSGLAGCGAASGWMTERAGDDFPQDLHVIGEVIVVATRDQALGGQGLFRGLPAKLAEAGYDDTDIVDGSVITVWTFCYGHNSGVPLCAHHGHYLARVPPSLRGTIRGDPDAASETDGDLVEIALRRTPGGAIVGELVAVLSRAGEAGPCRDAWLDEGGMGAALLTLGGVGPPRANWLECEGLEGEGWRRFPVPGAPASRSGPPVSQWFRSGMAAEAAATGSDRRSG